MKTSIYMMPCITASDAMKLAGVHSMNDFGFSFGHGSYTRVGLEDGDLHDAMEDLHRCEKYNGVGCAPAERIRNDIKFITAMRDLGYTDDVLICTSW